eukprot:jgi/Ulvmu1/5125/UM021_0142.1
MIQLMRFYQILPRPLLASTCFVTRVFLVRKVFIIVIAFFSCAFGWVPMQTLEDGAWGLDDGMKAPELDIVAICDEIREGLGYDLSERKYARTPACPKMPLLGWSFISPLTAKRSARGSAMTIPMAKCDEGRSRHTFAIGVVQHDSPKAAPSSVHTIPSLRSLALGLVAPFVADIAQESAAHLPSSVRETLVAIARRRHELTDMILLSLVDESFASLDLHGCSHIRPKTLVTLTSRIPMLQNLDISGSTFTSELIYSLPYSCPHLQVLRLSGGSTKSIDLRAWQRLIPRVFPSTADMWEDEVPSRSGGLICLRWLCWPDIPPGIRDLFQRQWPKVNLNDHAAALLDTKLQGSVPPEALPWVCLDDGPAAAAGPSAWRNVRDEDQCQKQGHCKQERTCFPGRYSSSVASDDDFDNSDYSYEVSKLESSREGCAHAVLQRWMDATIL